MPSLALRASDIQTSHARHGKALSQPPQQIQVPAIHEALAGRYGTAHPAAQIIRRAVPVLAGSIGAKQRGSDLAGAGTRSNGVEGAQRCSPPGRPVLRRKERTGKPSKAPERDQPVQRHELGLDAFEVREVVAQSARTLEQTALPDLKLDTVDAVTEQDVLHTVTGPQNRHDTAETPQVETGAVAARDRASLDR